MSIFAQYAKQAKVAAARTPLVVTSEAEPVMVATEESTEAEPALDVVEDTMEQVAELPIVDQFAQARERLNQTHHALIRGRSEIVVEAEAEAEPVMVAEAPIVEEMVSEDVTIDPPVVTDDVVETPIDVVPEGEEAPEEPALDVVAEDPLVVPEEPVITDEPVVTEEPMVDDEPVVDEDGVVPADIVEEVEETRDHDIDDNDAEVEITAEMEALADEQAIEALEAELNMVAESIFAVETYGINPTAVHIMRTTGLLEGTSIASLGLEAFGYEAPDHPDSQMALEALGEKMKEKAAQWSAKIVSLASSFGDKVMGVLNPLWDRITTSVTKLSAAAWDKAKVAGKIVKAHPYKTIIGVILAIAAAAGVVMFGAKYLPAITAKQPQVAKFVTDITAKINNIKWPFGDIKATVAEGGAKFAVNIKSAGGVAKGVAMDSLDWTSTMVRSAGSQLGRAWSVTKQGVSAFGVRAAKIGHSVVTDAKYLGKDAVSGVKKGAKVYGEASDFIGKPVGDLLYKAGANKFVSDIGAGAFGGWVIGSVITAIIGLTKVVYQIIAGGLRIVAATLNALIGGTKTAAA